MSPNRPSASHRRRAVTVSLALAVLLSVGCPKAPESPGIAETPETKPAAPALATEEVKMADEARAEAEEAEAEALRVAEQAAQAEREANEKALAEREAAVAEREEQLRQAEALRQERIRLAQQKAEAEERERKLAAKEKALENYEANLAFQEKELSKREAAFEDPTGVASEPVASEQPPASEDLPLDEAELGEPELAEVRPADSEPATGDAEDAPSPGDPVETAFASLEPGRLLEIEFEDTVSSATHREGDNFSGRLVQDLTAEDGTLVAAAGSEVIGRVTHVRPLKKVGGRAAIEVEFTHLVLSQDETVAISASFVEVGVDKRKDKKRIVGAAIVGAILGRVLGDGSEGVLAGAAAGAAAGTYAAARSKGKDAEIPSGHIVALQLEEVVTVEIHMTGTVDG